MEGRENGVGGVLRLVGSIRLCETKVNTVQFKFPLV